MFARPYRVVFFKDRKGEWRWSLRGGNGLTVACSSEGYSTKGNARKAFRRARDGMKDKSLETFEIDPVSHEWSRVDV